MGKEYNLTYPQKNIWMVEEFFGKSAINTIVGIFRINYGLNLDLCKKAINKLVELNEALRIRVYKNYVTDEVYQKVAIYTPFKIDMFELKQLNKTEQELNEELASAPFDVIGNPLYYFAIVKTGEDTAYIFVKLHHLIADAWTFSNIARELSLFIEQMEYTENIPSYLEYISTESEYVLSERFEKDKKFWEEYLSGLEENVSLKGATTTFTNAKRYSKKLSNSLNEELKNYCKVNRISPYTVFMVSLAIYIHRTTEKKDFVIGTPVLNRANAKEKKMIGMFVSTMPVRFKIDENATFYDMCKACSLESMSLFRHQKYPYSLIQKDFKEKNDLKDNLYSIMLSYQNARFESESEDKAKYTTDWVFSKKIQNELEVHIMDMDETGVLQVHFDYKVATFEDEEIKYLAKRIFEVIKDGIENNSTVENIKIMSDDERDKILNEFNDTARPYPKDKTVIQLFEEVVEKYPKKVALTFETEEMTYERLNEFAERLASHLTSLGVKESDCVAISVDKSFELLISIIAVLKLGAYYLPLELTQTKDKKNYMVKDTNCVIAITDSDENYDNIKSINVKEIDFSSIEKTKIKRSTNFTATSPVCVLYTSGTTGNPKGALIINKNITKLVLNPDYIEFKDTDTVLQAASTNFDVSLFEFWGPLLNGGTCALLKKQNLLDSNYLNKYIKERNVTIAWITQALFSQIIDNKIEAFETLRVVFSGGDVMSLKHVNKLREKYDALQIINCYGPTECVTFTNTFEIKCTRNVRVPLGKAISNTYGYVIDSKFRLLPLYTEGEYVIGGDSVALGYINNPTLTKEKFVDDEFTHKGTMYKTGDVVRMLEGGVIDFVGRKDNQVKIRGYRIELDEIKNVILSMPNVQDSVVIMREDIGAKRIYAYYVATIKLSEKEVIEYIKERLAKHMVPYGAMQLDCLPLNANGKVDRKNLPKIVKNISNDDKITETEKVILDSISCKLQIRTDTVSNLFEEGLDSLSVVNLAVLLQKEFNVDISTAQIMRLETVREIAKYVDNKRVNTQSEGQSIDKITSQQLGIYLEYMKNPDSTLYNIPFTIKFSKKRVNIEKLIRAVLGAINNHEIFFTKFDVQDTKVVQVKDENIKYSIKEIEASENEMAEIISKFVKPFDINTGPLVNIKVYVTENSVYLLCDFHHLIFDGYSLQIFLKNVASIYNGENIVQEEKTYLEYLKDVEVVEEDIKYFKEMLENISVTTMPYDDEPNDALDYSGNKIYINVASSVYEKLKQVSEKYKVTMNAVTQVAYMLTYSDFVKASDITFGTAFENRVDLSLRNTVGMFVKTLPFRYVLNRKDKVLDLIKNVQKDLIANYSHSSCGYEDIAKSLRKAGDKLVLNTMFVCQNVVNNLEFNKEKVTIKEIRQPNAKFDITFEILPKDDKLYITVEYMKKAFHESSIREFVQKYIEVLEYILDNTEQTVQSIPNVKIIESDSVVNRPQSKKNESVSQIYENLTDIDKIILETFKEVLCNTSITVNDNFFEVGGDSLSAMTLVVKLNNLKIDVAYADIFKYNTVKLLSSLVELNNKAKTEIDISNYDYSKINEILANTEQKEDIKINGVLLTGATGFLGAHILAELIESGVSNVYCLVRRKNGMMPEERLRKNLEYYFGNKYAKYIGSRAFVIEEDERQVNLPLNMKEVEQIDKNINIVINSAAYVKHFGDREIFEKVNVEGVNNLIKYCKEYNKRFVQISTISVSGNVFEGGRTLTDGVKPNTVFDESKLYVGQQIDNLYVLSKFLAERSVLESVQIDGLDGIILRVGNLMGRYSDGVFQQNNTENAFINRIKTFANIGVIPENIRQTPLEFTPVDMAAKAIVKLIFKNNKKVYHVYNINHTSIDTIKQILEELGYSLDYKSKEEVANKIKKIMKNEEKVSLISGIIQDLDNNKELNYSSNVRVLEDDTLKILEGENFIWKDIDKNYLKMFFDKLELNKGE